MIKFLILALGAVAVLTDNYTTTPDRQNPVSEIFLNLPRTLETKSNFVEKEIIKTREIKFKTEYQQNPEKETDYEIVIKKGVPGERREILAVTTWWGKPIGQSLKRVGRKEPQNEIVERGTKVIWKEARFGGTTFSYWKKLRVWATSYDANCAGCTGRTWAGTAVALGTCAVDPRVIALGSRFFVPGYGICRAEDIGGAIKGSKIDLGFPNVKQGFWSARFVEIYLMDGQPS